MIREYWLRDFHLYFSWKWPDRGLSGANGSGKTTLMKISDQKENPARWRNCLNHRADNQNRILYAGDWEHKRCWNCPHGSNEKVIDYIKNTAEFVRDERWSPLSASNMLERFYSHPSQQYSSIGKLSGGKRRLNLLRRAYVRHQNVLIFRWADKRSRYPDTHDTGRLPWQLWWNRDHRLPWPLLLDLCRKPYFAFEEDGKDLSVWRWVHRLCKTDWRMGRKVPPGHILDAKTIRQLSGFCGEEKIRLLPWITWKRERKLEIQLYRTERIWRRSKMISLHWNGK